MPAMTSARAEVPANTRLPAGFHRLIAAQFFSALADNAVLIVGIALLQAQGQPGWLAPMLKFCATLSYVLLAPFVGPLADAVPKARLMAWMNALKLLALLGLMAGAPALGCFALLVCGAAAYAPAKYGLATELVPAHQLVLANAWIEVSVVCAVLLSTVLGGLLVSQAAQHGAALGQAWVLGWTAPHPLPPHARANRVCQVCRHALLGAKFLHVRPTFLESPCNRLPQSQEYCCREIILPYRP